MGEHHCHATACEVATLRVHLMCAHHWNMVPRPLQRVVLDTYRRGQCDDMRPSQAYLGAAKAAVTWVARQEGRVPDTRLYDMLESLTRTPA